MDRILDNRTRTTRLILLVALAVGFIIAVRFFVLPELAGQRPPKTTEVVGALLDATLAILVASMLTAAVVRVLIPPTKHRTPIEIVQPFEILQTWEDGTRGTREWWYVGHVGRQFRTIILPRLASEARGRNHSIAVNVQILDPSHSATCDYYARYRQGLRSSRNDREDWTSRRVRNEVLASILLTYAYVAEEPLLAIRFGLRDAVSTFRLDLCSSLVIITKEDPQEPAFACPHDSFFYASFQEDARLSMEQGRTLPNAPGVPRGAFDVETVQAFFDSLGFNQPTVTKEDVREIISRTKRKVNPYG